MSVSSLQKPLHPSRWHSSLAPWPQLLAWRSLAGCLLSLCLFAGCKEEPPPAPKRTEPWPAHASTASSATAGPRLVAKYSIENPSRIQFALPGKRATPKGMFRIVRGAVELDLIDLRRSRGRIEVDLTSVLMDAPEQADAGDQRSRTSEALNWLDLGASKPLAERERKRFAVFELEAIEETTSTAPHAARVVKPGKLPSIGNQTEPDAATEAGAPETAEVRRVRALARGQLSMLNHRIPQQLALEIEFYYPVPATPLAKPEKLKIRTRRPLQIPLSAYAVKPRDSHGTLLSADLKRLGQDVGKVARLDAMLTLTPSTAEPAPKP